MKSITFLLLGVLALFACDNAKVEAKGSGAENSKVDIAALNQEFDAAWNAKDSARLVQMLADDVRLLEGRDNHNGKAELANHWISRNLPVSGNLKTDVLSSEADTKTAYEAGTYSLDVSLPDQKPFTVTGNYVFIWKKQPDNNWKIQFMQIENHDQPAPEKTN